MVDSLHRWETAGNIKMDLESSIGKKNAHDETVDELIKKLQKRGTKVKIVKDDEENQTPKQISSK